MAFSENRKKCEFILIFKATKIDIQILKKYVKYVKESKKLDVEIQAQTTGRFDVLTKNLDKVKECL